MGKKNVYSEETKRMVIELKLRGECTNRELMEQFGIKNVTQIKTWMRWYREEKTIVYPNRLENNINMEKDRRNSMKSAF